MTKLSSNYELVSDKSKNPLTSTPYIKHGEKWLDEMLNESDGRIDSVESGVAANAEAISQNTTNISTNTTNISGLDTRVTALEQGGGGGGGGDNVGRIDRTEGATQHGEIFNMYTDDGDNKANRATGYMSHAEGVSTQASAACSHAEGSGTTASGSCSHAEGGNTTASGTFAHAEGTSTTAFGYYSHAEGFNTQATASGSHAEGNGARAFKEAAHAEGVQTTADGLYAHAEGNYTTASAEAAHAEGKNSIASGLYSHAEGEYTYAEDWGAHSEGKNTTASGKYSHAENSYNEALGENSHAEGNYTISSGYRTHTEGFHTKASGDNAHAEGYYTKASSNNQHVSGTANIEDKANKYAVIVGNGLWEGNESNAYTLDWQGNAWYAGDVTGNKDGVEYKLSDMKDKYTLPEGGIPASDLAEGVLPTVTDEYNPEGTVPVSGKAVASAISGKLDSNQKGASGGVAELDENGKVLSSQLPSYVDDVVEASSKSAFPTTGESGKIYVDTTANLTYRWTGTAYTEISPSIALGVTASTAFRGDHGKTAYDHATTTDTNPHGTTKSDVGLGNVGNFKAVSTVASQGLTDTEKSNARANIGAGTYSKASTGIPKTDLASDVQASLGKADTALQSYTEKYTGTVTKVKVGSSGTEYSPSSGVVTIPAYPTSLPASDVQAYAKTGSGITVGVSVPSNAKFTDTTYSSKAAVSGGEDVSLVTTGEKATWNAKQNALTFTSTPSSINKVVALNDLNSGLDKKVQKTSVSSANKTTSTIAITDNSQMAMVAKISGKTVKDGTTLKSAAVESVVSRDSKGNVKTTVLVPSSVKNLPDYGCSVGDIANEIDFENGVYYHRVAKSVPLNWQLTSGYFYTSTLTNKKNGDSNFIHPLLSIGGLNVGAAEIPSGCARGNTSSYNIYARDTSITTAAAFNAKYGVPVVYELATTEVIPLTDFIRPLPVESGGTLTLVNEHNLDMPSVIKYKKEV